MVKLQLPLFLCLLIICLFALLRHFYNDTYTQLTCMSKARQALSYDSISHVNLNIEDVLRYQKQVFFIVSVS